MKTNRIIGTSNKLPHSVLIKRAKQLKRRNTDVAETHQKVSQAENHTESWQILTRTVVDCTFYVIHVILPEKSGVSDSAVTAYTRMFMYSGTVWKACVDMKHTHTHITHRECRKWFDLQEKHIFPDNRHTMILWFLPLHWATSQEKTVWHIQYFPIEPCMTIIFPLNHHEPAMIKTSPVAWHPLETQIKPPFNDD